MGYTYRHLSLEERCTITRLHSAGQSIRQIASALDRAPSTVARELKRNASKTKGYEPSYAWQQAKSRRWRGSRLERQPALRSHVLKHLAMGYSPVQVAGRLTHEQGKTLISHESIYRFIYAQMRRTTDGSWRHYLPQAKGSRGYRKRKGRSLAHFLPGRISVHQRPKHIASRKEAGHWEADLMAFANTTHTLVIAQERTSRLLMAVLLPGKAAEPVANCLKDMFSPLPAQLRQTITFDNGAEFAHHQSLPLQTFFCDPHSPWQKGGVENAIGRLRRYLPRNTDITHITQNDIIAITQLYNHTPRKCLDFKTPAEVFSKQLLHFKCESTPEINSA
jgi:IS30 family transposase